MTASIFKRGRERQRQLQLQVLRLITSKLKNVWGPFLHPGDDDLSSHPSEPRPLAGDPEVAGDPGSFRMTVHFCRSTFRLGWQPCLLCGPLVCFADPLFVVRTPSLLCGSWIQETRKTVHFWGSTFQSGWEVVAIRALILEHL